MSEQRYIELIDKEISGTITPRERDELHEFLRKSQEARSMYDQHVQTLKLLDSVPDVEPPAHLKAHIMNSVNFSRYRARHSRPTLRFLGRFRRLGLRPRLAYAFALGMVVGLVVFSQLLNRPVGSPSGDIRDFYGTIGIAENASIQTVEGTQIDLEQAEGRVDLLNLAEVFAFRVSLQSVERFEVILEFDPGQATFSGLSLGDGRTVTARTDPGYVRASGVGTGQFSLSFVRNTAEAVPVGLRLLIAGDLVHTHHFVMTPGDH
jgi:hypothetical protein